MKSSKPPKAQRPVTDLGLKYFKSQRLLIQRYSRWTLLSALAGVLAGLASTVFLISLHWATQTRLQNSDLLYFLPLIGFLIGWVYHHYGKDSSKGNNLILDEIHDPQKTLPLRMAPLVLIGTVLTHLFGGSAGREGTAVQMGATLADQLNRFFKIEAEERKILLTVGAGAGFGAAIGAPWAGVIFGMEVIHVGRFKFFALVEGLVASFVGYGTAVALGAPHSHFPQIGSVDLNVKTFFFVALAGILFGLTAKAFSAFTHLIENILARFVSYAPLKPFIGGLLIVLLFKMEGSLRYAGLGIEYIQQALQNPSAFDIPFLKSFFTAFTVGSGFKGGEFIPLVYIGTTLGSALSLIFPVSLPLLASVGFAAVFAGASNTPLACSIMAIEIFSPAIAPYAFVACLVSYYFSGHKGIYKSQKISLRKKEKLISHFKLFGELPTRFLK